MSYWAKSKQVSTNSSGTVLVDQDKLGATEKKPYKAMVINMYLEFEKGTILDSSHINCVILCKYIYL